MTMPWVSNNYVAVVLMGLALFGNQWVAATYIGTVGDVVPQHLAGRVNGIAGLGDNGAALLAVLYTGVVVDRAGKPVMRKWGVDAEGLDVKDGVATVGPTSLDLLGSIAEKGADHGIHVTAIGVGLDYSEPTLNALADFDGITVCELY